MCRAQFLDRGPSRNVSRMLCLSSVSGLLDCKWSVCMMCNRPQSVSYLQAFASGRCSSAPLMRAQRSSAPSAPCAHARNAAPVVARREALLATAGAALFVAAPLSAAPASAEAAPDGYFVFKPDRSKTPALRAGTVDRENPYSFVVPDNWKEKKVPNIQSGNYCQPRCAEPWTEVIFGDDAEGKASVIVSPLVRLTNKKDAKIEDIGSAHLPMICDPACGVLHSVVAVDVLQCARSHMCLKSPVSQCELCGADGST